ncbi:MAG TPA: hypothetical protein VHW00_13495 [Thermoanaerobaculia bacterium]|nr:hypothetical protein [Thermoanaerobaculia bacterium]
MSRRLHAVLIATTFVAALPALAASDDSCTRELPRAAQTMTIAQHAESLFAKAEAVESIETDSGVTIELPAMEVVVARIGKDGKVILGCVDSATAAKRFFEADVANVPTKSPVEK